MYLEESMARVVNHLLQGTADAAVCIADGAWRLCALTDERQRGRVRYLLELCAAGGDWKELSQTFSVCIRPCCAEDTLLGYIIVLTPQGELLAAYAEALLLAEYSRYTRSYQEQKARKRALLANQLAGSGQIDSEAESYFRALNCTANIPRCAILCVPPWDGSPTAPPGDTALSTVLERWAREEGIFSAEDIYGQISTGLLLIFKAVSSLDSRDYRGEVEALVDRLSAGFSEISGKERGLHAFVGSAYAQAEQLHLSYGEADYLFANQEYCLPRGERCAFINHFLFEYLFSRMDSGLRRNLIQDVQTMLDSSPALAETAVALACSDSSPIHCAKILGVHRNTVLQRLQKMKSAMALDPLYSTRDRVALHVYTLQKTKKTVWNCGIIVQPSSVLYQGLRHLAEELYKASGGTFQLNIHTISTSGDNYKLFNMLVEGALDLVVGSTIALQPYTEGRTSALQLPFLFDTEEEAECILQNTVLPELRGSLSEAGILCPVIWSMGWRYLTSRETPIRTPEDMRGRRIRILASSSIEGYFSGLGAEPLQIYYNNIREALSSGIISCQENPYSNILSMEFYRYQDYVMELPLWYSMEAFCLSEKSWLALEESRQELLRQYVAETSRWLTKKQRQMNQQAKEELQRLGMTVVVPTAAEEALWRDTIRSVYNTEKHQIFLQKIQEAKRQYAKKRD